ncbi:MAG TPA: hypothetical protein VGB85_14325 [Nannocystis sp.]|jgi:hypothetical protein
MFKIPRQQMAEIARTAARNYEDRMVRQLGKQFPGGCFGVSRDDLADMVQQGIERAAMRKITSEKHVAKFIALATALGQEFDMDPKLPWAGELLDQITPENVPEVLDALSHKAAEHLMTSAGADNVGSANASEAAGALTGPPQPGDEPLSPAADVGDPVAPCPKLARRRLYSFSS